jgi:hypothetical protein
MGMRTRMRHARALTLARSRARVSMHTFFLQVMWDARRFQVRQKLVTPSEAREFIKPEWDPLHSMGEEKDLRLNWFVPASRPCPVLARTPHKRDPLARARALCFLRISRPLKLTFFVHAFSTLSVASGSTSRWKPRRSTCFPKRSRSTAGFTRPLRDSVLSSPFYCFVPSLGAPT